MTTTTVRWISSNAWELPFFGLPSEIPWPAEVDPAVANQSPLDVDHLLTAIELLGDEATDPWKSFLAAAEYHEKLGDALEDREMEAALAALDEIDRIHPGTAFALFHRAQIARAGGDDEQAVALYGEAAGKAPSVGPIWGNLGSLQALRGEKDQAIGAFQKALEITPNDLVALEGLTALRELVKLKTNDPRSPHGFQFVSVPVFRQMALQQVQALTDPEQLLKYADQLLTDGSAPEAGVRAVERAAEIAPGNPRIMLTLGAAYGAAGQLEQAKETMERFTQVFPQEPAGFLQLARACHTLKDEAGERAALDRVLELDPNSQQALMAKFRIGPGDHDPKLEDELAEHAAAHKSWMAYLVAAAVARTRGDKGAVLRHVKKAMELDAENEEVLINYASAIGDLRELSQLTQVVKPAVESGKYSKRLAWTYAQVLRQLNMTDNAVAVVKAAMKDASPEFLQMAEMTIDSWTGLITGCGVRLETHAAGFLPRPILIALPDGDGGVLIQGGSQLPAEATFTWKASGDKAAVSLQQGETGIGKEPLELGVFLARGIQALPGATPTIECHLVAHGDGTIHFRAQQDGRKLPVGWTHYSATV